MNARSAPSPVSHCLSNHELERLEGIIRKNVGAFYEVGMALAQIQLNKYYHDVLGHKTSE